ncbi:hypothetical protein IQ273_23805 [Nodosilinea sp. LEGE 07298]|uniref:toxin-antitoxin system TumE family protein n=1 Tax=Nodosilinea sp. LEGE 07298 TaxID=2777970 RepID=UPI00187F8800|nr:DUF6516 family protein [Nodosilinea sp. LEGE 07298]MBE9112423.1 hypothetical protein [Nodosilinea sp. LEGE 07298]
MSPTDYLAIIKETLIRSPIVQEWTIVNEIALSDRGHFRVRLTLANGDFVEASEFFYIRNDGIEQQRYRYQWMDANQQQLKKRWDNAPHFPNIETFPHHVHVNQENNVLPSQMFGIPQLVTLLEQELSP